MTIEIELAGNLCEGQPRHQSLSIDRPLSAKQIGEMLGLDIEEVGLIAINGVQSEPEDLVSLDSRLVFFPHLSGG